MIHMLYTSDMMIAGAEPAVPMPAPAPQLTGLRKKDKSNHGVLSQMAPKFVKRPSDHTRWKKFKAKAFRKEVLALWTLAGGLSLCFYL